MPAIPAARPSSSSGAVGQQKLLREVAKAGGPSGPTRAAVRARAEALRLAEDEGLVEAAYVWRIVELEAARQGVLHCGGEAIPAPWLIPASGRLTALAAGACTIGGKLEARVRSLFAEKRASVALALDTLGNELLSAASRRVQDGLLGEVKRRGLSMAGELRAGDPGLDLEAQGAVLRLARGDTIGIGKTRLAMLSPVKSMSVIYGVGVDLPPARWSRCDRCPSRAKCKLVARDQEAVL